jgi:hypothetical protein
MTGVAVAVQTGIDNPEPAETIMNSFTPYCWNIKIRLVYLPGK